MTTPIALPVFFRVLLVGLIACALPATDVELTWDANSETDLSHYEIHRSDVDGFTPGASTRVVTRHLPSGGGTETLVDSDISGGTWHYRVIAVDRSGNRSTPSQQVAITIEIEAPPARAITLSVTPDPGGVSIEHVGSGQQEPNLETGTAFPDLDPTSASRFRFLQTLTSLDNNG